MGLEASSCIIMSDISRNRDAACESGICDRYEEDDEQRGDLLSRDSGIIIPYLFLVGNK
jgi:hypothetical protein